MRTKSPLVWGAWVCAGLIAAPAPARTAAPAQSLDQTIRDTIGISDYTLQSMILPETAEAAFVTIIELDGVPVTLDFRPSEVRGDRFEVLVHDEQGLHRIDPPARKTYRGTVAEFPGSEAAASLLDTGLSGIIFMPDGAAWAVQPLSDAVPGADRALHVVYRTQDVLPTDFVCGVTDAQFAQASELPPGNGGGIAGTVYKVMDIGVDADYPFHQQLGSSVAATVAQIELVMDQTALIYERDCTMTFELTTIVIRTSSGVDPYTTSNPGALLDQFGNYWNANHGDIQRDVAHLFTGRNMGQTLGIAWLSVTCNLGSAYSVVRTTGVIGIPGRAALSAHELGHNLSAQHCSGSTCHIMCAGLGGCGGLGLPNFSPGSINSIRSYAWSGFGACMTDMLEPVPLPFAETVPTGSIHARRWPYVKGAVANQLGLNPPSPPYAIDLDTGRLNDVYDDELRSNHILMAGASDVVVQYWTQTQGVEEGESLIVEYRNDNLEWIELDRVVSDGIDQNFFQFHAHKLRPNGGAYHDKFRLRFRTDLDQRNDDFFIDNIRINNDPIHEIAIESVGATDVPIDTLPPGLLGNGAGNTPFSRQFVEGTPLLLTAPTTHQGMSFTEWRIDGGFATSNPALMFTVSQAATATAVYGGACDACDANCDGSVDAFDIEAFIDCLLGP